MNISIFFVWILACFSLQHVSADLREDWRSVFCGENISCYDVLGLNETCTPEDIEKAYKSLALQLHPDRVKTKEEKAESEEKFKNVVTAHEILKDPEKRKIYDEVTALKKRMWVPKEDPIIVICFCLLLVLAIAHYYQVAAYKEKKSKLMSHNAVLRRIRLKFKKEGKAVRTKNNKIEEEDIPDEMLNEIVKDLKLRIPGGWTGEPPKVMDLVKKAPYVPLYAVQYIFWSANWVVKYTILGNEYDDVDKEYLTRANLGLTEYDWQSLEPKEREDFISQELWKSTKRKKSKSSKKKA